jgi:hypothetical protein
MNKLVENNGFRTVNEPPVHLEKTFTYYKQLLKHYKYLIFVTVDRHLQQKIPVGSDEFYMISWNIPKLRYNR